LGLSAPEPLTAAHDVSAFSSGKPSLDHWLKTRALANQQKGFTGVLVVHDDGRVVGFYGLRTGQPPDPVPCLLLGQLAVDLDFAGRGVGTGLVKQALQRCLMAAKLVGGRALLVNAVDPEAAAFWQRRGFLPTRDDPLVLVRSLADIAASMP
jgi:GNAT superfamily N-acetyltransferase